MVFLCINALDHNCTILHRISHHLFSAFQLNFNDLAFICGNYFEREVSPHVPDAWIDRSKKDKKDGQVGIVGYEINFNRYFYQYQPPRPLEAIDADLKQVEAEITELLKAVAS